MQADVLPDGAYDQLMFCKVCNACYIDGEWVFLPGARPQQDGGVQERLCHAQVLYGTWKAEKSVVLQFHLLLLCVCHFWVRKKVLFSLFFVLFYRLLEMSRVMKNMP